MLVPTQQEGPTKVNLSHYNFPDLESVSRKIKDKYLMMFFSNKTVFISSQVEKSYSFNKINSKWSKLFYPNIMRYSYKRS